MRRRAQAHVKSTVPGGQTCAGQGDAPGQRLPAKQKDPSSIIRSATQGLVFMNLYALGECNHSASKEKVKAGRNALRIFDVFLFPFHILF